MNPSGITIIGLGPGDPHLITREAWELISKTSEIYLRTIQHPSVEYFPNSVKIHTFDNLYEEFESFDRVYEEIIKRVIALGSRDEGVIYAVPGHPFVAETTCPEIYRRAKGDNLQCKIVDGISFVAPVISALGIDLIPNTSIVDALNLRDLYHPPFPPDHQVLITQIYDSYIASEIKITLMNLFPDDHPAILVHFAGTKNLIVEEMHLYEIDRSKNTDHMSALYIPPLGNHTSFESLQEIAARLRSPDGCPWDQDQTYKTMRPHLLEETYELLTAMDKEQVGEIQEELGDLLLILIMLMQISSENKGFNSSDVIKGINHKLIHRHPHVFGDLVVDSPDTVLKNWEIIKSQEKKGKGDRKSLLDGVPINLPALIQAQEYQERAARIGFDWSGIKGVIEKIYEELQEINQADDEESLESELGDLLFALVNYFRWRKIDAESALRASNLRFQNRFSYIEQACNDQGLNIDEMSANWFDKVWEEAKGKLG